MRAQSTYVFCGMHPPKFRQISGDPTTLVKNFFAKGWRGLPSDKGRPILPETHRAEHVVQSQRVYHSADVIFVAFIIGTYENGGAVVARAASTFAN
eukprot:4836353-Pyramimonas_sp.AAC.1